jgi:protoporphyrin/coproporphyrin ferrochelatase
MSEVLLHEIWSYLMSRFSGNAFAHDSIPLTGILLTNLGSPDAPTPAALRRYLAEFLWDARVVEVPRLLWWLILHGIILRTRPRHSAEAYAKIWREDGASPLLHISYKQTHALEKLLREELAGPFKIALGMRYGNPSIASALTSLRQAGAQRILVLPLYPQYASATTGSTFDAVAQTLQSWRWLPDLRFISHYHDQPAYIDAIATSIRAYWQAHGEGDQLLFSFHGIPKRTFIAGDPYFCHCHKSARLIAAQLGLAEERWQVVFQSRFGREEWLQPYTDHTLQALGKAGMARVDVVCPGFAADCLETLEEIDQQNRALFLAAGGQAFHYIPALNDSPAHIQALAEIIRHHLLGWPLQENEEVLRQAAALTDKRAHAMMGEAK